MTKLKTTKELQKEYLINGLNLVRRGRGKGQVFIISRLHPDKTKPILQIAKFYSIHTIQDVNKITHQFNRILGN